MLTCRAVLAAILALAALAVAAPPAQAFGDLCCTEVSARGQVRSTMGAARASAIAAWEKKVQRQRGARFADWYYSGDRLIDCGWDASGRRIRCTAMASPCGRRR